MLTTEFCLRVLGNNNYTLLSLCLNISLKDTPLSHCQSVLESSSSVKGKDVHIDSHAPKAPR